jgi:glyoxylase-like metal-dependent hydrolase (beta-lactamase superfamily II)
MMNTSLRVPAKGIFVVCAVLLGTVGCTEANEQAAVALGGRKAIQALQNEVITSQFQRFDPGQTSQPNGNALPLPPGQLTLRRDFSGNRLDMAVMAHSFLVPDLPLNYEATIAGEVGSEKGIDALFQPPAAGLQSSRVASTRKEQKLLDPIWLLRRTLDKPSVAKQVADEKVDDRVNHVLEIHDSSDPVRLYIDALTGLPTKARVVEEDPMTGDAVIEALYNDWRPTGDLLFPHSVQIAMNGVVIDSEQRTVETNVQLPDADFEVDQTLAIPHDEEEAERGEHRSEWFQRFLGLGLNLDDKALTTTVQLIDLAPGVVFVGGSRYNSLGIELPSSIVVVEAPLDDTRSKSVIAALQQKWPNKPIKYVINTHLHFDHSGGLRTYVAAGATVVTAPGNESYFKDLFQAPHTVVPDSLATNPATPTLQTVPPQGFTIQEGSRVVQVLPVATSHVGEMLVVYLPAEKLLFTSDLFNPLFVPVDAVIPSNSPFYPWARELWNDIGAMGLDVQIIAGGHGGVASLQALKTNSGN